MEVSNSCLHCSAILYHTIVVLSRLLPHRPSPALFGRCEYCWECSWTLEICRLVSKSVRSVHPLHSSIYFRRRSSRLQRVGEGRLPLLLLSTVCSSCDLLRARRLHAVQDDGLLGELRSGLENLPTDDIRRQNARSGQRRRPLTTACTITASAEPLLDIVQ